MKTITAEAFQALEGHHVGTSRWFVLDQARIDAFAEVTEDNQFIHVDPARAAAETPFGGTIAHGFLSLSMLPAMFHDAVPDIEGAGMGVNYGFDKVRFLVPVRAGDRVRGRFRLARCTEAKPGEITTHWDIRVEIEGGPRDALAARWIGRRYMT